MSPEKEADTTTQMLTKWIPTFLAVILPILLYAELDATSPAGEIMLTLTGGLRNQTRAMTPGSLRNTDLRG